MDIVKISPSLLFLLHTHTHTCVYKSPYLYYFGFYLSFGSSCFTFVTHYIHLLYNLEEHDQNVVKIHKVLLYFVIKDFC